jgi:hypothetical protein
MFDLSTDPGNEGYRLTIYFNKKSGEYTVAGFHVNKDENGRITQSPDGATLSFPSMADVMKFITDYGVKQ